MASILSLWCEASISIKLGKQQYNPITQSILQLTPLSEKIKSAQNHYFASGYDVKMFKAFINPLKL